MGLGDRYYARRCLTCDLACARDTCVDLKHEIVKDGYAITRMDLATERQAGRYQHHVAFRPFIDFCKKCGMHETEHAADRCLLMAARMELG
jgi:hypothetical protein